MPRTGRIVIPNRPHHVVQRGHNRATVFAAAQDYLYYLTNLAEFKNDFECLVYGYCLMTNHVHLIIDPCKNTKALALLMKRVAARQTRYVNKLEGRTGSLWEGRYKSSPVDTNRYLLACTRYVELNPVRAQMVSDPLHYRWSSYSAKIGATPWKWLDIDPCYRALGETDKQRQSRYKRFVEQGTDEIELKLFREAAKRGQLTGDLRFQKEISRRLKKRIENRGPGRPRHEK